MNFFNNCNDRCNCQNNWHIQNNWFNQNNCCNYYPQPCWFLEMQQDCCRPCSNNTVIVFNSVTTTLVTSQTVTSPNLFDLGTVTSSSGPAITFNSSTNEFTVLSSGTYRVSYSFDYLSGTTGVFGVECTSLPATRSYVNATQDISGSVSKTTDVVLTAGQKLGLQLLAPDGTATLSTIDASNLFVNITKIL